MWQSDPPDPSLTLEFEFDVMRCLLKKKPVFVVEHNNKRKLKTVPADHDNGDVSCAALDMEWIQKSLRDQNMGLY